MSWKMAVGLTLVTIAPLSAQRSERRHSVRVDVPPIVVDVPRVRVDIPPMNISVPTINVDIPSFNFSIPAINIDIPAINFSMPQVDVDVPDVHIDLSGLHDAMRALDGLRDIDVRAGHDEMQVSRVKNLMREWRSAVRNAEDTGDWEQADDLARELSRAADRLNPGDVRIIKQSTHKYPRS